jgi:2-polyprenyl-6-methoxyphenol hydroxylase-like FAD-dependent oxidoreductase
MAKPGKVVIVGGGVGGLSAAIGLTRAGIEVEVHEKYDHLARRATALTLWSFAIEALRELGVDDPDRFGSAIELTEIRERDGTLIERVPVGDVSRKLGTPSYEVDRREFRAACLEQLGPEVVRTASECVGIEQGEDSATALLAGGGRAGGELVIGADGAHSVTRGAIAGEPRMRYAGHTAWAGVLEDFAHPMLEPGHHVEVWPRGSIGGVADLGGGRVRWYVTQSSSAGDRWGHVEKDSIATQVEGWYDVLPAAVDAADPESIVTMEAWELEPLGSWFDRRLVLLGDAAHLTTPSVSGRLHDDRGCRRPRPAADRGSAVGAGPARVRARAQAPRRADGAELALDRQAPASAQPGRLLGPRPRLRARPRRPGPADSRSDGGRQLIAALWFGAGADP